MESIKIGMTASQYHANLDKLWRHVESNGEDVFTLIDRLIVNQAKEIETRKDFGQTMMKGVAEAIEKMAEKDKEIAIVKSAYNSTLESCEKLKAEISDLKHDFERQMQINVDLVREITELKQEIQKSLTKAEESEKPFYESQQILRALL